MATPIILMDPALLGQKFREEALARAAEIRETALADAEAAREAALQRAAEARQAALEDADLAQHRALAFRLTGEDAFLQAERFAFADLDGLSGSGVEGAAILGLDEDTDTLTVAIQADGLEPGLPHPQHIHGFMDGTDATSPTLAQDDDGDGFIELAEGQETYGPILLALTADPDNGEGFNNGVAADGPAAGFPVAPDGSVWFVESYQLPQQDLGADPMLSLREIVLHGMTVPEGAGAGTPGEVDGSGGYKAVLPVASGEVEDSESVQDMREFAGDLGLAMSSMSTGWATA